MIKIYNTRTKAKEHLPQPKQGDPLRIFVCGPTVYDYSHIGHARTYAFFDSFVKYLRTKQGVKVRYLQNITDIDDKIIQRANEQGIDAASLAKQYREQHKEDMSKMGITSVDEYASASDFVPNILEQVKILIDKGYAYEKNGSVYFRVSKFEDYGKLSGQNTEQLQNAEREANTHKGEKESENDFVIWKKSKQGEPQWESPYGQGRPGWHIEDTAITHSVFGEARYEVHGGAQDLIFPHHEAEIALMESSYAASPFVDVWIHAGFLNVKGEKMSKSLGNFIIINDILSSYSPQALRMFFATRYYRSPIDYTEQLLKEAEVTQKRVQDFKERVEGADTTERDTGAIQEKIAQFWEALEDDFNTPRAFSLFFEIITEGNTMLDEGGIGEDLRDTLTAFIAEVDAIFFILKQSPEKAPDEIYELAEKRKQHRQNNQWEESDAIRTQIQSKGYTIEDLPNNDFKIHEK